MTTEEFLELLKEIQIKKCETNILEIKCANEGCPKRLFDTLSSFSNQDEGGVIIFGINESDDFKEVGVYDPQDLQKKVNEQCLQMQPEVRPLLTVLEKSEKFFVSAEIPGIDLSDRPCYYKGKGRIKGSYTRVGDSDEPMTEYEVYSYEAFRKKFEDDTRVIPRVSLQQLDQNKLDQYIQMLKNKKARLSNLDEETLYGLTGITNEDGITLSATMLFSPYPQAYFPQLSIVATVIPGTEMGEVGIDGERFLDNERMEGNIPEMLEDALRFINRNMRHKTIINPKTGRREDKDEYPMVAVREAIVNALIHRDYSIHTETQPIQILMFDDRMEIRNPGGLYGRVPVDQLGKVQPNTRNPVLATAMEDLGITENRYSGIPTIRREMREYGLCEPIFSEKRGTFCVTFYKEKASRQDLLKEDTDYYAKNLVEFCAQPRTRQQIADYLGISTVTYAINAHVMPLVKEGIIKLTIPEKPSSSKQLFYSNDKTSD